MREKVYYKSLGGAEEYPEGTIITAFEYNRLKKLKSGIMRHKLFQKVRLMIADYETPYWNDIEKFYYDYIPIN